MKKAYTEYCAYVSKWAKAKGETEEGCTERLKRGLKIKLKEKGIEWNGGDVEVLKVLDDEPELNSRYYCYVTAMLELAAHKGHAKHFFIQTPEMAEWLVSCVPDLDKQYELAIEEVLGKGRMAIFHIPTSMGKPSLLIAFAVPLRDEAEGGVVADSNEDEVFVIGCYSRQMGPRKGPAFGGRVSGLIEEMCDPLTAWYIKLAYGTLLYAHCFPEAIKDGVPEDLQHPSHHQYEAQTLEVHPRVCLGGTHASPHAHYRKGYFKTLRHERWGRSKGKTIFVHETFVKGRAQTVLEPEEVQ